MSEVATPAAPAVATTPATPVAPATPAAPATIIATPGADPVATPAATDWAPNWRDMISSDEKHKKTLDRFASPKALYESYESLRGRVSNGELKAVTPFPDKGTDEQKAQWRAENGVPAKVEDYDLKFENGLVIGEADKPLIDGFLKNALDKNMPTTHAKAAVEFYYKAQEEAQAAREKTDGEFRKASEDALRAEWGAEFRTNVNRIGALLDATGPAGLKDQLMTARLADGSVLGNNPAALRWLADVARQLNPVATVVPNAGANVATAIDDEIKQIETTMRKDRKAYNLDTKMQARYMELLTARERVKQ